MIVRISSIAIPKTKIIEYWYHVERERLPVYEVAPGLDSVHFLQRALVAYYELITISVWDSEEALTVFLEKSTSDSGLQEYAGIEFEPRTYELLLSRKGKL